MNIQEMKRSSISITSFVNNSTCMPSIIRQWHNDDLIKKITLKAKYDHGYYLINKMKYLAEHNVNPNCQYAEGHTG